MKKVLKSVLLTIALFVGFSVSVNAVRINFLDGENGNEIGHMDINNGRTQNITVATPSKTGYDFAGWATTSGSVVLDNANNTIRFTGNTNSGRARTVYATYSAINYTISYDLDGGSVTGNPDSYNIESSAITLNNPTKDGYNFLGWTGTGLDSASDSVTIANGSTGDRSYTATYEAISYDIVLDLGGGSSNNPISYTVEDGEVVISAPSRVGYNFLGWQDETGANIGTELTIRALVNGSVNYTALWEAIEYNLTYNLDGGEVTNQNPGGYTIESPDFTLTNPEKEGYDFAGWTGTDLPAATEDVTIASGSTGDREFNATYTPTIYTITYELDGGNVDGNPDNYTIESDDITLINPTKEGYRFLGWIGTDVDEINDDVTIASGSIGNRTFRANWELIPVDDDLEELNGEGTSDLDDTTITTNTNTTLAKSLNPQTDDEVVIYISLLALSMTGLVLIPKKRYNN